MNRQEIVRRKTGAILPLLVWMVFAFLAATPVWASSSSCSGQSSSNGCSTINNQFNNVNTFSIAANLTYVDTNVFAYQQTSNSPCIYDNASCNNGSFPTVLLSGDTNKDNVLSKEYTVAQIQTALNAPNFFVGIDVNDQGTKGQQLLERFDMYVNGTLTYSLGGGCDSVLANSLTCNANLGKFLLDGNNPGNGYSDDLITGFSLAGLNSTDKIQFVMTEHADVAGREQFFLIGDVPEPATFVLMGTALALLGLFARRLRKATV